MKANQLETNITGRITAKGENISVVNGREYWWSYRATPDASGKSCIVPTREGAAHISCFDAGNYASGRVVKL